MTFLPLSHRSAERGSGDQARSALIGRDQPGLENGSPQQFSVTTTTSSNPRGGRGAGGPRGPQSAEQPLQVLQRSQRNQKAPKLHPWTPAATRLIFLQVPTWLSDAPSTLPGHSVIFTCPSRDPGLWTSAGLAPPCHAPASSAPSIPAVPTLDQGHCPSMGAHSLLLLAPEAPPPQNTPASDH